MSYRIRLVWHTLGTLEHSLETSLAPCGQSTIPVAQPPAAIIKSNFGPITAMVQQGTCSMGNPKLLVAESWTDSMGHQTPNSVTLWCRVFTVYQLFFGSDSPGLKDLKINKHSCWPRIFCLQISKAQWFLPSENYDRFSGGAGSHWGHGAHMALLSAIMSGDDGWSPWHQHNNGNLTGLL